MIQESGRAKGVDLKAIYYKCYASLIHGVRAIVVKTIWRRECARECAPERVGLDLFGQ